MRKKMLRILVFLLGLLFLQGIISYVTIPVEVKNFRKYLKEGVDCIYFCDSTMRFYPGYDTNREPIIDLMKEDHPLFTVETVDHPGYNADIYYSYCKAMAGSASRPKAVIIPISLYSLSVEWLKPGYNFELEKTILKSTGILNMIFYRNITALNRKTESMEQYLDMPVYNEETLEGKVGDFENKSFETYSDENFKKKIILRYMFKADAGNLKIQSLIKLAEIMKNSGIKVVYYVTPVDYETCGEFYGPEFLKNISRNISFLSAELNGTPGLFLDFSRLLGKDSFAWKETFYVNEHMNFKGRSVLASSLTVEVNKLFEGKRQQEEKK